MGKTSNRFIATLAISNILAFVVIFTLLWMLWNNQKVAQQKAVVIPYTPEELAAIQPAAGPQRKAKVAKPSVNARDVSIITAVAKEVKSNIESSPRVTLNGASKNTADTSGSNADPNKITGAISDSDYVASYNDLATKPQPVKKEFTEKEISSATARTSDNKGGANMTGATVDHFNKVDVSQKNVQGRQLSLAQQVAMVASSDIGGKSEKSTAWKDYLNTLKEAEAERRNEMRTITVRNGDTLWKISERAYGTGFKYQKIFTANPHLTSPDSITVGETLRVPL